MNRLAPPFIYGLIWLAAFAAALMPFPGYEPHSVALSVTLLASGMMFIILKHPFDNSTAKNTIIAATLMGALWLVAFLSTITSEVFYTAFVYFGVFSALPLSFFWMLCLYPTRRFTDCVAIGLGLIAAGLSVFSLLQYFSLQHMLVFGRVQWPLANPNSLGAILSLLFFPMLGAFLLAQKKHYKNLLLILLALIFAALLTTVSRGATLSLLFFAGVFLWLAREALKTQKRSILILCAALVGATILIVLLNPGALSSPQRVTLETLDGTRPVFWASPDIWISAWQIIKTHLWTGTGIGTFFLYYPEVRGNDFYTAGLMVHNDPLQFWAEMGIAAPLLFYGLGIFILLTTLSARKKIGANARIIHLAIPACALGALALHSHITYNFYVMPCLALAGLYAGYWAASLNGALTATINPLSDRNRILLKSGALTALFAALFLFLCFQGSVILANMAQKAAAKGDIDGFAAHINHASKLSLKQDPDIFILAASIPLNILEAEEINEPQRSELLTQGLSHLQNAENLNPRDPDIFYHRARLYKAAGENTEAEENLERTLNLDPSYMSARQMLADLHVAAGEKHKALEILKDGMKWADMPRDMERYINQLAFLSLELGDMKTHNRAMQLIGRKVRQDAGKPDDPNDPVSYRRGK